MNKRTLKELAKLKRERKKFVIWKLSDAVKEEVEEIYNVEVELYRIETKHLKNFSSIRNENLKKQHIAFKNNKKTIVLKLNKKDMEDFIREGVRYTPYKYRINLI